MRGYAGSKLSKIAEHGGNAAQDRHVGLVVYGASIRAGRVDEPVETAQVAPTILHLLGLPPHELKAVRAEQKRMLPEIER